jgi:pimeloyl-ACP methyl ester carboxylesterase
VNPFYSLAHTGRRLKSHPILFSCLVVAILWVVAGFLATIPIMGNHRYWRQFRAWPGDFGLIADDVTFPSQDGISLTGWYISSPGGSRGTVIIAHGVNGNRSDMLSRAAILVRHHYNTLLIDLRDHGRSGGNYAGPGYIEARDLLGALKYLKNRGQTGPFVAMGHSYGGVAAIYAAAQSPDFAAVISDSGYISFEDMVGRATVLLARDPERSFLERLGLRLAGWRAVEWVVKPVYYVRTGIWLTQGKTDTLVPIAHLQQPILLISGERDEICPPKNAKVMLDMARSSKKQLLVVPNAEHDTTLITNPQLYESAVVRFLENALPVHA